mmetsp:Transcript_30931/g.67760  ORF Transcript_30931/g.67760 Transcript_30931/m.67760 type:complete len:217 (-) Transcript_30931:525-1175(-)
MKRHCRWLVRMVVEKQSQPFGCRRAQVPIFAWLHCHAGRRELCPPLLGCAPAGAARRHSTGKLSGGGAVSIDVGTGARLRGRLQQLRQPPRCRLHRALRADVCFGDELVGADEPLAHVGLLQLRLAQRALCERGCQAAPNLAAQRLRVDVPRRRVVLVRALVRALKVFKQAVACDTCRIAGFGLLQQQLRQLLAQRGRACTFGCTTQVGEYRRQLQ